VRVRTPSSHDDTYKIKGLSRFRFQFNQVKTGRLPKYEPSQKGKGSAIIPWGPQGKGNFLQTQYTAERHRLCTR